MLRGDRRGSTRWTIFNNLFAIINRSLSFNELMSERGNRARPARPGSLLQRPGRHIFASTKQQREDDLQENWDLGKELLYMTYIRHTRVTHSQWSYSVFDSHFTRSETIFLNLSQCEDSGR